MHLDEIYSASIRKGAVQKTIDTMQRLNRNKKVALERIREEERREIERENIILNKKLDEINKGHYVGQS